MTPKQRHDAIIDKVVKKYGTPRWMVEYAAADMHGIHRLTPQRMSNEKHRTMVQKGPVAGQKHKTT